MGAHALPSMLADVYETRESGSDGDTNVMRDGVFHVGPQNQYYYYY